MRARPFWMVIAAIWLLAAPFAGLGAASEEKTEPAVLVGVPDSGINPYHEQFHRPELTEEPCSYIEGFPCTIKELPLTIGGNEDYEDALEADEALWETVEPETWYWIPKTPFVAVYCEPYENRSTAVSEGSPTCILDDGTSHGTATTSTVLQENPDALIAFKQGTSNLDAFEAANLPVDVYSVSWGTIAPIPLPLAPPEDTLYVKAAGNDPWSAFMDGWSGHPDIISVSGAHPDALLGHGDEPRDTRDADVVAWYCRSDMAAAGATSGTVEGCGTSYSAPTVAGALSKTILDIRNQQGYHGPISDGQITPDITTGDLREAMNHTATYDPDTGPSSGFLHLPLFQPAPYLQWGWGWYDASVTDKTLAYLDGKGEDKPLPVRLYMGLNHEIRSALYGW